MHRLSQYYWTGDVKTLLPELFAVGCFSFVGVAVRLALSNRFSDISDYVVGSDGTYINYFDLFYSSHFLLPNILGCFCMALLTHNATRISSATSPELYKGLTSGFCGCLTTFASWIVHLFHPRFSKTNVIKLLIELLLQFFITWSAFIMGFGFAETVDEIISMVFICREGIPAGLSADPHQDEDEEKRERGGENEEKGAKDGGKEGERDTGGEGREEDLGGEADTRGPRRALKNDHLRAFQNNVFDLLSGYSAQTSVGDDKGMVRNAVAHADGTTAHQLWGAVFFVVALPLWIALAFLPSTEFYGGNAKNAAVRLQVFRSLALAPFGAWLRLLLSRAKPVVEAWPAMHTHTLLANTLAVLLDVCLFQFAPEDSTWTLPVANGVAASLSTVSTFFLELRVQYSGQGAGAGAVGVGVGVGEEGGERSDKRGAVLALRYCVLTFVSSIIIMQAVRSI